MDGYIGNGRNAKHSVRRTPQQMSDAERSISSMKREDIHKRVDLRLRYKRSGLLPDSEYIFGVLIFLATKPEIVEQMIDNLKENKDVDVYLLVFEEGHAEAIIERYVALFKETFPDTEIREQRGYSKDAMDYMSASMEIAKERRLAMLN